VTFHQPMALIVYFLVKRCCATGFGVLSLFSG
jgi:hypothetical protein